MSKFPDLVNLCNEYLIHLETTGAPRHRQITSRLHLKYFLSFLRDKGITCVYEVRAPLPEDYICVLYDNEKHYSPGYRRNMFKSVKAFFAWLLDRSFIGINPFVYVNFPRGEKRLPRDVPDDSEVKQILEAVPKDAFRDRALIEVLYGSGLRRSEVTGLTTDDIDFDKQLFRVHDVKNRTERIVPFNDITGYALKAYLEKERSLLKASVTGRNQYYNEVLAAEESCYIFISGGGRRMSKECVNRIVKKYAALSGIKKKLTAHSFRHACASEMLKGGAGIRWIQKMLGHKTVLSTMVYTRLGINDLKEGLEKIHPHGRGMHGGRF